MSDQIQTSAVFSQKKTFFLTRSEYQSRFFGSSKCNRKLYNEQNKKRKETKQQNNHDQIGKYKKKCAKYVWINEGKQTDLRSYYYFNFAMAISESAVVNCQNFTFRTCFDVHTCYTYVHMEKKWNVNLNTFYCLWLSVIVARNVSNIYLFIFETIFLSLLTASEFSCLFTLYYVIVWMLEILIKIRPY